MKAEEFDSVFARDGMVFVERNGQILRSGHEIVLKVGKRKFLKLKSYRFNGSRVLSQSKKGLVWIVNNTKKI